MFTVYELIVLPLHMGLAWDEVVYVSQASRHAPASYFDSARAWGVTVLVAPVTLLTSSFTVLRAYLAVVAGAGLLAALWAWRRLRPAWVLALGGVLFCGLWVTQFYAVEAMPDLWSALSALAAVGCFLTYATGAHRGPSTLAGLGAALCCVWLFRPGDGAYLSAPMLLAWAAVAAWRRWQLLVAMTAGGLAGVAEWVAEANTRFGGVRSRLHLAGIEQGGFGLHVSLAANWHGLTGPLLCRPCTTQAAHAASGGQWWFALWWPAVPLLVAAGVVALYLQLRGMPRDERWGTALLPVLCGICLAAEYLVMVSYAAPRFLLPSYALLAIPVADTAGWLLPAPADGSARQYCYPAAACWSRNWSASMPR